MELRRFAATAVMVALVSGCQTPEASSVPATSGSPGSSGTAASPDSSPAAGSPAGVKEGGILVFGLEGEISYADSAIGQGQNDFYVMNQVLQGLVGLKPGSISEVQPVLAADLPTVSDDGLSFTFTLRSGVEFHDGTAFDSAAVKYNYERQRNFPEGPLQTNDFYYSAVFGGFGDQSNIASIDTPDPQTVVFHLRRPQANFLITQTIPPFFIQSPTALEANGANNPALDQNAYAQGHGGTGHSMVGTGPFAFEEWVPNDHLSVVKNASYWDPAGAAHLDKIIFRPIKSGTAKLQSLQSGDIDVSETIVPGDAAAAMAAGLQVIDRGESCNIAHLGFNQAELEDAYNLPGHRLVQNRSIRLAIANALNKQAYLDTFYAGFGNVADNWMPRGAQYFKALDLPGYDPDKAKELVADSGVPAEDLEIDFYYPSDYSSATFPDPSGLAQAIAADVEAVGIKVNLKTEGFSTGYRTDRFAGKFPMWLTGWNCDWAGPDNFLDTGMFHYEGTEPGSEFGYRNDELNTTMNDALAAPDDATARGLWEKAQDLIAADMPSVPLVNSVPPGAMAEYVRGFQGAGNLGEFLNTVWLDK